MKRKFHEIPDAEWEQMKASRWTWADVMSAFDAPEWCTDPAAHNGAAGCCSLTARLVRSRDYCQVCELSIDYAEPEPTENAAAPCS